MTAVVDHNAPPNRLDADPVLEVDGLTVDIRTITGTVRAVNEVTFQARRGETLALLGESGCGKSMTATALVGLLEPVADVVGGTAHHSDGTSTCSTPTARSDARWPAPNSRSSSRTR